MGWSITKNEVFQGDTRRRVFQILITMSKYFKNSESFGKGPKNVLLWPGLEAFSQHAHTVKNGNELASKTVHITTIKDNIYCSNSSHDNRYKDKLFVRRALHDTTPHLPDTASTEFQPVASTVARAVLGILQSGGKKCQNV